MKEIIKLNNQNCVKCPFKQLEIITFNPIIKSCQKCNDNEYK
jgi:hypothetical protein